MRILGLIVVLLACCGPSPGVTMGAGSTSEDTSSGGSDGPGTAGVPTTSSALTTSTTSGTSTTAGSGTTACDSCGDTSTTMDAPADLGVPADCDVALQDCPAGEKCVPEDLETHCVPLSEDPLAPGDPCAQDEFGGDRCPLGSACPLGYVGEDTAVCIALCNAAIPVCPGDLECIVMSALEQRGDVPTYAFCLRPCDPLAPVCGPGEECTMPALLQYAMVARFACIPAGIEGAACESCAVANGCATGLACTGLGSCDLDDGLACRPYCDLDEPGCANDETCSPWYEDPPPGLEHVGVCT